MNITSINTVVKNAHQVYYVNMVDTEQVECNQNIICEHDKLKTSCRKYNPNTISEHGKNKRSCKECNPNIICEHGKRKSMCKECTPSRLCKHITNIRYALKNATQT